MQTTNTPPPTEESAQEPQGPALHMGVAEQGKVYALEGNYTMALAYYRQAIQMARQANDPEVFFRHYLECTMEALEQMGSLQEVLDYTVKALAWYEENPPPNTFAEVDRAHLHQRQGITYLRMGQLPEATKALDTAVKLARPIELKLPLAQTLVRWLQSGLSIDDRRLQAELNRHKYFSVRKDTVNPQAAVKVPNENMLVQF